MAQARIEELRDVFRQRDRAELEELVLASSMAHAHVCEIASARPEHHRPGEHEADTHGHASESEMRERIQSKSTDELADLLAELAVAAEVAKV